jgi:MFS family permease
MGGFLLVLMLASAFMRTRYLSGQFWMDEAITTGISSHSLSAIPGILRHDGNPPLYYMLLHVWIQIFGASESATHALSLLFGLLTIPVGFWAGWSLFGRRAGIMAAVLLAFSAFLTQYAQETRMYELMGLLGLFATAGFLHGFVFGRRKYLIMFSIALALMLYTQSWGVFFWLGSAIALIPVYLRSDDRRGLLRDAAMSFIGAGILYLPWLPNFLYQAKHTAAPWDSSPHFGAPVQLSRNLLGGDRVSIALLLAATIGVAELFTRAHRRTREATVMWTLIAIPVATLALAWVASQITPAWVPRYFAPVLGAIVLLAAFGCARSGVVGIVAIVFSVIFLINPASYTPAYKSDVRDISGEMTPRLHPGDLVVSAQPEQTTLAWYYMPPDLRYASTLGPVSDPSYMDWIDALKRLQHANPQATLGPLLASLKPGQQILYVRPLTEGVSNWKAPWTQLVRRRAAQWGAILAADHSLRAVAVAPHNYRGACCVANSAVLYQKVSAIR